VYLLLLLKIVCFDHIDHDIPRKSGCKVTVKLVGYLTHEIGGEEESTCDRFIWGLIPGISVRLLEEKKKIKIPSFWGQL
jgi:hypothetical protein